MHTNMKFCIKNMKLSKCQFYKIATLLDQTFRVKCSTDVKIFIHYCTFEFENYFYVYFLAIR